MLLINSKFRHTRNLLFRTELHILEILGIIGYVNMVYSTAFREQLTDVDCV